MFPTLVSYGRFSIPTYGVFVAAGYVAAILWLQARRKDLGLTEDAFWDVMYWLVGGALVGGKIAYVIVERDLSLLWREPRYGFVFYGGFLGACLTVWIASRRMKFPLARLADYVGVALPLGHAIGRLGCVAAGCCYGRHTDLPWGIPLAGDPSRHPTQLYEAAANIAIAVLIARAALPRVRDGRWKPGAAFILYIALYAVARFTVEIFRGDDRGGFWFGLSPSQWGALAALVVCGVLAARRRSSMSAR